MVDMDIVERGRKAAANIAEQGINGWGNTMNWLCDEVERLREQLNRQAMTIESYMRDEASLRTQLDAVQKDAERLDYLDTLTKRKLKVGRKLWPIASDMHFSGIGVSLYVRTGIGSKTESQGIGKTVRAAIDQAMQDKP